MWTIKVFEILEFRSPTHILFFFSVKQKIRLYYWLFRNKLHPVRSLSEPRLRHVIAILLHNRYPRF